MKSKKKGVKLNLNPHSYGDPLPTFLPPKVKRGGLSDSQCISYIWQSMSQHGFLRVLGWCLWAYFIEYLPKRKEYGKPRDKWLKFMRRTSELKTSNNS